MEILNIEHDDDEEFGPPFLADALCHIIDRGATERPFRTTGRWIIVQALWLVLKF